MRGFPSSWFRRSDKSRHGGSSQLLSAKGAQVTRPPLTEHGWTLILLLAGLCWLSGTLACLEDVCGERRVDDAGNKLPECIKQAHDAAGSVADDPGAG